MRKRTGTFLVAIGLLLGGCSAANEESGGGTTEDGEATEGVGTVDHGIKDAPNVELPTEEQPDAAKEEQPKEETEQPYELAEDGELEEVTDIPEEEKLAIMDQLDEYIRAINEQNIDAYVAILSPNENVIPIEAHKKQMSEMFETVDVLYEPTHSRIVAYDEKEGVAQVFTTFSIVTNTKGQDDFRMRDARQVTMLEKVEGEWKVAAFKIEDDATLLEDTDG